jgi:hypothetical protein
LGTAERHAVEKSLDPAWIAEVEGRFNTSFLPTSQHVALLDALVDVLGTERTQRYFAEAYLTGFSTFPMVRTLIEGTLRTFGASPGRLAKVFPRAWDGLAEHTGDFVSQVDFNGCTARLDFSGLAAELSRSGSWVSSFAGVFDGFIEQCGRTGIVEVVDLDLARGAARYLMRWDAVAGSDAGS